MKTGNPAAPASTPSPPCVLLCVGQETWLKEETVRLLKAQCLASGFEEMDLVRFGEPPEEESVILAALRTPPFGSLRRLVIVEGFSTLSAASAPWLIRYAASPHPKACLAVCAQKLGLPVSAQGGISVKWCEPLKGQPLRRWILDAAGALGKGIDGAAADLLMTRLGNDLASLHRALEALTLFVGSAERIRSGDVEKLVSASVRETAFDILDGAASGRPAQALEALRQSILQGRITLEQLMGALGWYYRMVLKEKNGPSGGSWISGRRQAALSRLARVSPEKLKRALVEVLESDLALKRGHPAPELLVDQLLVRLAGSQ